MALFDTVVDGVGFSAEENNIVNGMQFFLIQVFLFLKKLCLKKNGWHNQGKKRSKWLVKFRGKNEDMGTWNIIVVNWCTNKIMKKDEDSSFKRF